MGGRCCAALTPQAGAGRPGRRSADLHVGAPAGRTRGLSAAGAGSLRRRRLSCLINLRPRGGSRWEQTARASRRPSDHWRCDRTRALERLPHRCAVRRRPLTPPRPRWCRPLDTRPLDTRPPEPAPGHLDPALAPPTRPLPLAPLPFALPRAQVGPPLALPERLTAGGRRFSGASGACC